MSCRGHDLLSCSRRAWYSRAWSSHAAAATSTATNVHHGKVVVAATCRHAAATAHEAADISRAATMSFLGACAVNSQT